MRLSVLVSALSLCLQSGLMAQRESPPPPRSQELLDRYCATCHSERIETAGLSLEQVEVAHVSEGERAELWEKVVRKLRTGAMPPPGRPQPPTKDRTDLLTWLETSLDAAAAAQPNPGRTETLRRLNRTEYQNAIRDLLALDIDAKSLLPPDESGHGFDNVTVGDLSPALLDRYITAAQRISRLAIGSTQTSLQSESIRVASDVTQEAHVSGLPIGTRGGAVVPFVFAQDGEYEIQIRLARNRNGLVGGLRQPGSHTLDLLLDRSRVATFTVDQPPEGDDHSRVDEHLKTRIPVTAGPHDLGVTFLMRSTSLAETERQPLVSRFNQQRHPRLTPAIYEISITGPYAAAGADDAPSRRRIFTCRPTAAAEEPERRCASATALAKTPAKPVPRLGYVFIPMGCDHARWTPPGQGALGELSPILAPLDPVRDQLTILTNLELENSYPGTHDTSNSGFLSAAFAKHTESSDYHLGTTADQLAARQIGQETQLASLELSMDLDPLAGVCNNGYACVYQNCLSWSSPTTPLPSEAHPRVVFERLFGEGGALKSAAPRSETERAYSTPSVWTLRA